MRTRDESGGRRRVRAWATAAAVAAAAALVLSGCSGGGGQSGGGGSNTLTVWHYFSDPNQVKLMKDYADVFQKNNKGVTVQNVYVPYDQMDSKLIASAGAKSGPDVAVFNGADTANLALANVLAPLSKQWSSFADKSQFPDSVVHQVNGEVFSLQGYVNLLGLWYNADILKKIGVTPPTTMAELDADMAKAVQAGYQGITLSGLPQSQGEWQAFPWLSASGLDYAKPTAPAISKGLSTVRDWVSKGYLSKEAATWDQTVPFQKFAAGNVAFAENGNWQAGTAKSTAKFTYGVAALPVGSSGKIYLGGEGEGIGKYSKNPALAWKYLQQTYLAKDQQLVALNDVGSIPSRTDAAGSSDVTGNPILKPFADEISANGAAYPPDAMPAKSVNNIQLAVGQAWSASIGGQSTPEQAGSDLLAKLQPLLKQ